MYPTQEENAVIEAAEQLMTETMARYDPSHDVFHVQRVRKTALHIARVLSRDASDRPDLLTVELAALLHDVLDKKYVSAAEAADPYAFFLPFFQKIANVHGVDLVQDGRARIISRIADNVSWSTEKRLRVEGSWGEWHQACIELHCVQDADRLDAIGAFGILRCAAYSAATNQYELFPRSAMHFIYSMTWYPVHCTPPADDAAHSASAVQHFYDKLLNIRGRLKTEPGKHMAEKRHKLMLEFLQAVDEEYNLSA